LIELWTLVFAKYPLAGTVNTRMCPPLTSEQAAEVQRACLGHVLARAQSPRRRTLVAVAPDESMGDFQGWLGDAVELWPQGAGDLGTRLARAASRAFAAGAPAVLFLGTDSPTLPWGVLAEIPAVLRDHDAVIGPCADGGYYAIALAADHPALFENIAWGSSAVSEQTRHQAEVAGLRLAELPPGYDLDRVADLHRAVADLDRAGETGPLSKTLRRILATIS
jgi:rSAM/selenodomain-associated transferase 1